MPACIFLEAGRISIPGPERIIGVRFQVLIRTNNVKEPGLVGFSIARIQDWNTIRFKAL